MRIWGLFPTVKGFITPNSQHCHITLIIALRKFFSFSSHEENVSEVISEGIMGTCAWEDHCGFQELRQEIQICGSIWHTFSLVLVETTLKCSLQSGILQISAIFLSHGCQQEMCHREPEIWPESQVPKESLHLSLMSPFHWPSCFNWMLIDISEWI